MKTLRDIQKPELEEARKTGMREVVEWVNGKGRVASPYWHSLLFPTLLLHIGKWQAKLKEWGIDETPS